eukprot:TRINITY_DN4595_c2_g2_i1.p1 TRINITY_DN4595_c2_g2~~TRINITY_DN4595_c2_g2_i1.p1  ORF type:complete len:418 (+),score=48.10 TRINITY_DN4595_c2_g2_i1:83-1336(+)
MTNTIKTPLSLYIFLCCFLCCAIPSTGSSCDKATLPTVQSATITGCDDEVVDQGDSCAYTRTNYICDTIQCMGNGTWNLDKPGCQRENQPIGAYAEFVVNVPKSAVATSEMKSIMETALGSPYEVTRVQTISISPTITKVRVEYLIPMADRTYNTMSQEINTKIVSSPELIAKYMTITDLKIDEIESDDVPNPPTAGTNPSPDGASPGTPSQGTGGNTPSSKNVPADSSDSTDNFPWIILAVCIGVVLLLVFLCVAYKMLNGGGDEDDNSGLSVPRELGSPLEGGCPSPVVSSTPYRRRKVSLPPLRPVTTYETVPGDPITPTLTPAGTHTTTTATQPPRSVTIIEGNDIQMVEFPVGPGGRGQHLQGDVSNLSISQRSFGSTLGFSRNGREMGSNNLATPLTPHAGIPHRTKVVTF